MTMSRDTARAHAMQQRHHHRARLNRILAYTDGVAPLEVAITLVAETSGRPRDTWEHIVGHPLGRKALKIAKEIAAFGATAESTPIPDTKRHTRRARTHAKTALRSSPVEETKT